MNVANLEFDREKVLSWWTGRISNSDLAEWTGQTERDVRYLLSADYMKNGVQGGGRGSKNTRRLTSQVRNSVAMIAALRRAGMSIELAVEILNAVPVLASFPTKAIDFSPTYLECPHAPYGSTAMLAVLEPNAGWLPTDNVPWHLFHRRCRPMAKETRFEPYSFGEISWYPEWLEEGYGGLPPGWKAIGEQMYRPEIDYSGVYEFGNNQPDASDILDSHFYIIDGSWVFTRYQDPEPRQILLRMFQKLELNYDIETPTKKPEYTFMPIAKILPDGKSAVYMRGDEEEEKAAWIAWKQYRTKLDINSSLAIQEMKRAAYGLIPPP